MLNAFENTPLLLDMLEVKDSDLNERTTSQLALDDWTGKKSNEGYLNRIRIKLEVTKGHIQLNPTARDISVTGNSTQLWWVLSRNQLGHDLCGALPCIESPAACLTSHAGATPASESVTYQDVCSLIETTSELIPFGKSSCTLEQRHAGECTCQIDI